MKIKLFFFILLFLSQHYFSQNKEWNYYDLDSIVSLEMPFIVYEQDTVNNYGKTYQIFSNNNTSNFISTKGYLEKQNYILPNNKKELENICIDLIEVIEEISPYQLDFIKVVKINDLIGYHFALKDKNDIKVNESMLFLINKTIYSFNYLDDKGINEIDNERFFNSIYFDKSENLSQFKKTKISAIKKLLFGLFIILIISFLIRIRTQNRKEI